MRLPWLAALVLTACGGGSGPNTTPDGLFIGPPPTGVVYVTAVAPGSFPDDRLGEFAIDGGGDGQVRVRSDILSSPTLARRTIAHELGHAVGVAHLGGNCVVNPDLYQQPDLVFCSAEVGTAGAMPGALVVYVGLAAGLLERTTEACDGWNGAVGRVLLDVQ